MKKRLTIFAAATAAALMLAACSGGSGSGAEVPAEALQEEQEVLGPGRPSVPRMRTPKGQAPRQAALPEARMGQQPGRWS